MSADAPGAVGLPGHDGVRSVVRWWWLWGALAVMTGAITAGVAAGFNIVDLELAGTLERADEAVAGMDLASIRLAIYWDFAFMFFYALALCTGSLWARRQFGNGFGSRIGVLVAIGATLAGVFDVVENLSMLGYLNGWWDWSGWIPLAEVMAVLKFLLVFASLAYILIGVGGWAFASLADRRRRR